MPDDLKIIATIAGGVVTLGIVIFYMATRPFKDDEEDIYHGLLDEAPETPEDEARRRPF